jgi:hypothetical protein
MAIAILAAVVGLLVAAAWAAARARRKFPLALKPAPWSSDELDGLSSDLTDFGGHDPIAALARADSAANGGAVEAEAGDLRGAARRGCAGRRPRAGRRRERRSAGCRPRGRGRIPRNRDDGRLARRRETRNWGGSPASASGRKQALRLA